MSQPIIIDYYSDILCVWAWIAHRRLEELERQFGDTIMLRRHYVDIFGDCAQKISGQWADRGGYTGFAEHLQHACQPYDHAPIHARLWLDVKPTTSANAHLFIKAVQLLHGEQAGADFARQLRQAFFVHAKDISQQSVLLTQAEHLSLDMPGLKSVMENGLAIAALTTDYRQAASQGIKGSPSLVFNQGRQTLYGNVGYRILQANIEELLKSPATEASWC